MVAADVCWVSRRVPIGGAGDGADRAAEIARVNLFAPPLAREGRGTKRNKATAKQSPLLMLLYRLRVQKNVYASAIGLCKDSIIIQSRKPSNSDF